ncbi:MAG: SCO family protein [Pirellulales bacterium]|nr:SCO family protein [Pirellulales bacterium]
MTAVPTRTIRRRPSRWLPARLGVGLVALLAGSYLCLPLAAAEDAIASAADAAQLKRGIANLEAPNGYVPRQEDAPAPLQGVNVTEHLGDKLPLELTFKDERNHGVRLADYFDGQHPVILTMNYSDCPMLCSLQLEGLVECLQEIDWTLGHEYRIVTVSINPNETTGRAQLAQQHYLRLYQRETRDAGGWHFLTGQNANVERLAKATGFGYAWVPERKEFAHAAVAMVCTPDGRLSRYLYGVHYQPQTVRLSLVEASDGRIGTATDKILLFCFHYDSATGRYGPAALRLMRAGGALTVGLVLVGLWQLRRVDRRRQSQPDPAAGTQPDPMATAESLVAAVPLSISLTAPDAASPSPQTT